MPEESHILVDLVKVATERERSGEGLPPPKNSSSAIYLIFIGFAVLGFAVVGFLLTRARRKAAEAAYNLRKLEEEQRRAREQSRLDQNAEKREAAFHRDQQLCHEIEELKKRLKRYKAVAAERMKALQEATSWEELGL